MKIIIPLTIILILLAAGAGIAYAEYRRTFYVRMAEPEGFLERFLLDHPDLKHESFSCMSSRNCLIKGLRLIPETEPKALIVMTHGYNMSLENYLPLGRIFCRSGFMVIMFDGVGVGMSEGKGIYGLPQHILDMQSVLDAVSEDDTLSGLPLLLFGHSWGGYAACTVSCLKAYPIRGILTCSSFRNSSSSKIPSIKRRYPHAASFLVSAAEFMEKIIFGSLASVSSPDGLKKVSCPVLMYHSTDDSVVSFEESFVTTKHDLEGYDNISFVELSGRNHNLYLRPENDIRQREIRRELKKTTDKNRRDILTEELWALMSETDEDLAAEFAEFFSSCADDDYCHD